MKALYNQDFYLWTEKTAQLIKDKQFDDVDWENLIAEIISLGKSEQRAIRSHLVILLQHLLKWQYQSEYQSKSWRNSINNARDDLTELLEENPSLKGDFLAESLPAAYSKARKRAADETTIYLENFPESCPYAIDEILSAEFLPKKQ